MEDPPTGTPALPGLHGRGLFLVDALAARWGSEQTPTGKTVWCEVTAPKPTPVRLPLPLRVRVRRAACQRRTAGEPALAP